MAVEQRQSRIVGDEIHLDLLVAPHHHHVLHRHPLSSARPPRQFKSMPMQVNRMNVVAGIAHPQPVSLALLQMERSWRHASAHRIRDTIDRPAVEAVHGSVLFGEQHVEGLVRPGAHRTPRAQKRVVPLNGRGATHSGLPFWPAYSTTIAHAMMTVVFDRSPIIHTPGWFISTIAEMRSAVPNQSTGTRHRIPDSGCRRVATT